MSKMGQGLQMLVISHTDYKAAVLTKRHDKFDGFCKAIGKYF